MKWCLNRESGLEKSITEAFLWSRHLLTEYEAYLKGYHRGFDHMELVASGAVLGIRETRRIDGDYVLTIEDMQARASFEDEIGRCISTDRPMQGSARLIPCCCITGRAAGAAAAMAAARGGDVRGFAVEDLQKRLKADGAFLPNCPA